MRAFAVFITIALASSAFGAESELDHVRNALNGENYTITWGPPRTLDPAAELEIGDGNGHGFTLSWMRFRPEKDDVHVLSIRLDQGRHPYNSKWPPDRAPVTVKHARMKCDAYNALLR